LGRREYDWILATLAILTTWSLSSPTSLLVSSPLLFARERLGFGWNEYQMVLNQHWMQNTWLSSLALLEALRLRAMIKNGEKEWQNESIFR